MMATPVPAPGEVVRAGLLTAHLTRSGGGVFTSVRQFARVLEGEPGVRVEVFGPARRGKGLEEWRPLTPQTSQPVGPRFFSYAPGLGRQIRRAGLDLVHLHGLWMHPSMASLAFTRRTGRPHIVSPHGMLDPWALGNSGWKKRLAAGFFENANLRSAACLHALNAAEAEAIRDYGFSGPVCVIPNGVDLPPAGEAPPAAPWWTKNAPEKKTLLYLGRLHPKKGLPNLLKAWSLVEEELREEWRLVIAGWDERGHHGALRRMAIALGIEAAVTFPGPVFGEDKRAAFHHCEGFILPSLSEGLPMVLLEAWACGKPVLMTPQCNLPEGFEAGAAVRIEPEEESLREGLTRFLAMEAREREGIGKKGRELAATRFSWKEIGSEMADVYRWVAGKGPRPGSVSTP
jgi:poly(glycerol-phosphate) alpha-glucosyltransferase